MYKNCKINLKSRFRPFVICLCRNLLGFFYILGNWWSDLHYISIQLGDFVPLVVPGSKIAEWTIFSTLITFHPPWITCSFSMRYPDMGTVLWNDANKWTLTHTLYKNDIFFVTHTFNKLIIINDHTVFLIVKVMNHILAVTLTNKISPGLVILKISHCSVKIMIRYIT